MAEFFLALFIFLGVMAVTALIFGGCFENLGVAIVRCV